MEDEAGSPALAVRSQLDAVLASIQTIENQVARGRIPGHILGEFKSGVDEVRLRLWALMASATSGDPAALQRFRLLRTAEVCRNTSAALGTGEIDDRLPEVEQVADAARPLATGSWRTPLAS
ncbi:MAG TPA: hypothetical protein VLA95_01195 [Gemmatimonadales bacterium]|nr:hypothetical protein [Gemmatimonadales bacterium]